MMDPIDKIVDMIDDAAESPRTWWDDKEGVRKTVTEQMDLYRSSWIKIEDDLPEYEGDKGIVVMIKLRPKKPGESPRMHGDIFTGVFYAGKFHQGFRKGFIMDVIEWMHIPNY